MPPSEPANSRPTAAPTTNGTAKTATQPNGSRKLATRPPASKLSRPGDVVARASRPPASSLSRPGDVARASRPPASSLSRPGDVARSQKSRPTGLSRPGDVARAPPASRKPSNLLKPSARVNQVRAAQKRKSASPAADPQFSSDSEGESDFEKEERKIVKKPKVSNAQSDKALRTLKDPATWSTDNGCDLPGRIEGADVVSNSTAQYFMDCFGDEHPDSVDVQLAYPSAAPVERFKIARPRRDDYNPHEDICETMRQVLQHYFPSTASSKHLDEASGLPYQLTRSYNRKSAEEYKGVVEQYNNLLAEARGEGTLEKSLDDATEIMLPLVQRILDQITARTVSPHIDLLKTYEQFSRNTYGELMTPFNSHIFRETKMDSSSVFLDLGSGVGNVVLQAALEVGCESHGIEEMPNCCRLAREQEVEFNNRCKMWGLSHGLTNLLQGNFLEDPRLPAILQRADVVLVNNVLFPPEVNDQLTSLFLDLKDGAQIVSLKTFVPEGWKLDERRSESILGMLEVEKNFFWNGCVSWTNSGGDYFIATKDVNRIQRELARRKRRG